MNNRKVDIFDTSLRDGFQGSRKIAKVSDKIEIAKALDNFGVDMIEVGFARSSIDDFNAIKTVSDIVSSRVYSLARANIEDIQHAYDAVKNAQKSGIHTFIGTSPTHRIKLNKSEDEILESIKKHVSYTYDLMKGDGDVMFSPEDALRTEMDYLLKSIDMAVNSGANIINIPDTVGVAQAEEIKQVVSNVRKIVGDKVKISIHTHNDLGNASSNSLASIVAGADVIQGTFPPLFGERAGNADLVQVITNLLRRNDFYNVSLNKKITLGNIYGLVAKISEVTGERIPEKYPIIGRGVHTHGSGIHQDGVNKRSDTYEILAPEEIGLKREQSFFLTNLSGRAGIKNAISKYFLIEMEGEKLDKFYESFMLMTSKMDYIEMDDVRELLLDYGYDVKRYVEIDDYNIELTPAEKILAQTAFYSPNSEQYITEFGVGAVDAIFNTIKSKYDKNNEIELIDFTIDALGRKTSASAKVYMKLQIGDRIYEEEAISSDIVKASIKAYLNGMDRILRDKKIG